jgi:hypothetical protein
MPLTLYRFLSADHAGQDPYRATLKKKWKGSFPFYFKEWHPMHKAKEALS